jgi:copper chaperone CopZ
MQILRLALPVLLLLALAVPAHAEDAPKVTPKKPKLEYVYLSVTGAKTDALAATAQRHVAAVQGVQSFEWTAPRTEAKVIRIVGQAATPTLVAAFQKAGLGATSVSTRQAAMNFQKALHCNGCVIKVRRALKAVKGTKEVHIAKDKLSVIVVFDTSKATLAQHRKAVAGVGYPTK